MDCNANCRYKKHGDYISSVVSKEALEESKNLILKRCANPFRNTDSSGRILLHIASTYDRGDIIDWLVSDQRVLSYIHTRDRESGWSALHRAVYYGHIDCVSKLFKLSPEWRPTDREGFSPLDLAVMDSPRGKKKKEKAQWLAIVDVPFEASEPGELTIQVGDIIVMTYKGDGWGFGSVQGTLLSGRFPIGFVTDFKDINKDGKYDLNDSQNDVYTWGVNVNFTLGHGDSNIRPHPELVEALHLNSESIVDVVITKFHTIFLTSSGKVYSCGHDLGGRLGHGDEKAALYPTVIKEFIDLKCIAIAAAQNHTMILDDQGVVHTFGKNDFCQLGHYPPPKMESSPKPICSKAFKGETMIAIAAGRFHSVVCSKHNVYAFGLNAGQLGLNKGEEFKVVPTVVARLQQSDGTVKSVATSDGATACLLSNGDIYLLQNYACRKIASEVADVKSICMSGGMLTSKSVDTLGLNRPEPLCIAVLCNSGLVEIWRESYRSFKSCLWLGKNLSNVTVVDICLGKHLLLVTSDGQVYSGHFSNKNIKKRTTSTSESSKVIVVSKKFTLSELVEKSKRDREDLEEVHVEHVPLLFRAISCKCDPKSRSFAVIQKDPKNGLRNYPQIAPSTFKSDILNLLTSSRVSDELHDVVIKTSTADIPAHFIILSLRIEKFKQLFHDRITKGTNKKWILDMTDCVEADVMNWLTSIYTGENVQLIHGKSNTKAHSANDKSKTVSKHEKDCSNPNICPQAMISSDDDNIDVIMDSELFALNSLDLEDPTLCDNNFDGFIDSLKEDSKKSKNSAFSVFQETKKMKGTRTSKKKNAKMTRTINVEKSLNHWRKYGNIGDVVIESSDKQQFNCHKSILISRLEYFASMLSFDWLQFSDSKDGANKMEIPGNILEIILDFLYTDGIRLLQGIDDISFIGEVIIFADQLLIKRLKNLCELELAKKVSLKNVVEIFDFACTYNANQLKDFCCSFISLNLPYFLEARLLEDLSSDYLKYLSQVYQGMVIGMDNRKLKPATYHIHINKEEEFQQETLARDLAKLKRKKRCSISNSESESPASPSNGHKETNGHFSDVSTNTVHRTTSPVFVAKKDDKPSSDCLASQSFEDVWSRAPGLTNSGDITPLASGSNQTSHPQRSPNKAFKKPSQKQRKQQQQLEHLEKGKENDRNAIAASQKQNKPSACQTKLPCPWGSKAPSSGVISFRDVLSEESIQKSPLPKLSPGKFSKSSQKKGNRITEEGSHLTPSTKQVWAVQPAANDVPEEKEQFSTIVSSQIEEKKRQIELSKKPLALIQLEERAIEELTKHYLGNCEFSEQVTVRRVSMITASSTWDAARR